MFVLSTISVCVHQLVLHPQASIYVFSCKEIFPLLHCSMHRQSCVRQPSSVWSSFLVQGVYVTLPQLEEARREAKNGTQLARKLMDAFWDRETMAHSSLSSKSKYQYQQLDPNAISAIEGLCFFLIFPFATISLPLFM